MARSLPAAPPPAAAAPGGKTSHVPGIGAGWPLLALLVVTVLRLAVAGTGPLAPDEAYYWVWSHVLQPGYLDHPPMVALWIRAGTLLAGDTGLGVRLLGPVSAALGTLMLWQAGNDLFPGRRPGLLAALLFNATLVMGIGSLVMAPDTPLLFFWTATLWALARLRRSGDGRWWLAVGLFAGAALLSKYTAALLGLGLLLWLLGTAEGRGWLRRWHPWAGGALAVLLFAPVVLWNGRHGWASFARQGGRTAYGGGESLRYVWELIGGQIGLATPLVLLLCVVGVAAACRDWWRRGDGAAALLACLTVPGALLFLWQATGSRVQGNWPAMLYPAAVLAAAALPAPRWTWLRRPALWLGGALTAIVYVQAVWAPVPLSRHMDPTLARLGGWPEFVAAVDAARRAEGASFVAAEEYGLAAELAFRLPPGVRVIAIDPRWALFDLPHPAPGSTGIMVRSERRGAVPPLWPGPVQAGELVRERDGIEAERYRLYRVTTRADAPPTVELPRPAR